MAGLNVVQIWAGGSPQLLPVPITVDEVEFTDTGLAVLHFERPDPWVWVLATILSFVYDRRITLTITDDGGRLLCCQVRGSGAADGAFRVLVRPSPLRVVHG